MSVQMIIKLTIATLLLLQVTRSSTELSGVNTLVSETSFVKRVLAQQDETTDKFTTASSKKDVRPTFLTQHRRFENTRYLPTKTGNDVTLTYADNCDAAFLNCLGHEKCMSCFTMMELQGIDWAGVAPNTPCSDILKVLYQGDMCLDLKNWQNEIDTFCDTFDSCVIWDDKDDDQADYEGKSEKPPAGNKNETTIDCDVLTECKWNGMHHGYLGDGICHDKIPGCYNHAICGYDGGDCCEDTCKNKSDYVDCGVDGFHCRDPKSKNCDVDLTSKCEKDGGKDDDKPEANVKCAAEEAPYRLIQYDSFGDGWDLCEMTITKKGDSKEIYKGGLKDGSQGTEYICLASASTCYNIKVSGGIWGNEVSWEIKPMGAGAPAIADGGTSMNCDFPVGGKACDRTCEGKPSKNIADDPDYKSYNVLTKCIKEKCPIQLGTCNSDPACQPCLSDDIPGYCYANDNHNALISCSLCHCMGLEDNANAFCETKPREGPNGANEPTSGERKKTEQETPGQLVTCNADQTLKGSSAILKFSTCSGVDSVSALVTNFDENNFGALDVFERCSHTFKNEPLHGGKTAMNCMQILVNAMKDPAYTGTDSSLETVSKAVTALATNLYQHGEAFCECASTALKNCPICQNFVHFKTLLYETLDACQALDEIDCDAWVEFHEPCKASMVDKFGSIDFDVKDQCDFIHDTCGNVGPFPAFRRLDCNKEISKQAWDFYISYQRGCLKGSNGGEIPKPDASIPATTPKTAPTPGIPVVPSPVSPTGAKPYVPPPDDTHPSASSYVPEEKRKRHGRLLVFLFVCAAGGLGYWYHKKRSESFDFVRYRRARNYGADSEMFQGLSMESGSSSFEPPTLPPTPSATEFF